MTLLRGNFEEAVRIRQVGTMVHTKGVKLLWKVVTLRVLAEHLNNELEELSNRCHLTFRFQFKEQITHRSSAKGEYKPAEVLIGWCVIRFEGSVHLPMP